MRSKSPYGALSDIDHNIRLARSFIEGFTFETFHADPRTVYAVIRCLEIISEASRKLPEDLKQRHPQIPRTDIAGAGSVYRHDYEDVLDRIVWHTARDSLSALLAVVEQERERLR